VSARPHNTASVAAAVDVNSANNSSGPIQITVNCPDVDVDKVPVAGTINAGEQAAFDIIITNLGPGTATNVTVHDVLPTDGGITWSVTSVTPGGSAVCNITGPGQNVLDCTIASLGVTSGDTNKITVRVTSSNVPNVAEVCDGITNPLVTVDAANEPESNNTNNTDGPETVNVNCGNVQVTKTPDAPNVNAGDEIGFTITVNIGGSGSVTTSSSGPPPKR
jgi:uncharacterized repeat protein (TIGR01451 family)